VKDLIVVTSYCPDEFRESILRNLIISLKQFRDKFDVMVVSHTPIPKDVQQNINYYLYDSKNEILTGWDLLNQPWFNPNDERRIQSSFLTKKNTHLAVWRLMILGFANAKNLGYKKVHHIEYDCNIINEMEFLENSKLLDEFDSVVYIDKKDTVDDILFGSFQSVLLSNLDNILLELDEDRIIDMIRKSDSKSPELMLQRILENGKMYKKDRHILELNGNKFGMIDGQIGNNFIPWAVPFYDRLDNSVGFVVWNTKNLDGVEFNIIVNNEKLFYIPKVMFNHWVLITLGVIDEINNLLIIENNQVRDRFNLTSDLDKDVFKKSSFRHKEIF